MPVVPSFLLTFLVIVLCLISGAMGAEGPTQPPCPISEHVCKCSADLQEFQCKGAGLEEVPKNLPSSITKLDLSNNNITSLNETSLIHYSNLEELILSDNKLDFIHPRAFIQNTQLKRLILQNCELTEIPTAALKTLKKLQTLNIGQNTITVLQKDVFPDELKSLLILLLKRNQIAEISENAFVKLTSLKVLELDDNYLTHIPLAVTKLPQLQELSISGNRIKYIPGGLLQQTPALALLELRGNSLEGVDFYAFSHLPRLRKLILSDAKNLSTFPNLNGTSSLEVLRLDRASLSEVPTNLCTFCPKLKSLDLKSNQLNKIPDINDCIEMRVLDLANNKIRSVEGRVFRGMYQMHDLLLSHNEIQYIPQDAFYNLTKLQVLV